MVEQSGKNTWQGIYRKGKKSLRIHSRSGVGDVVAWIGEKRVRAECKKGNLFRCAANPEYGILREALGQLLTVEEFDRQDVMVVAVPRAERFIELAALWRSRPLMVRSKIRIVLVGRDGTVDGLDVT